MQTRRRNASTLILAWLLATVLAPTAWSTTADGGAIEFDDIPLDQPLEHPGWFKASLLDLQEDLEEAVAAGKSGIAVYFGQSRCAYCKQLMEVNFGLADIVKYTRENFDVIPIDIWSPEEIITPDGRAMSQRRYAIRMGTNFTPSLIFYDATGRVALSLRGYYPPYQFRAALEYVAGGHYLREPFPVYLARGDSTLRFEAADLVEEEFFIPPPHHLDRSRLPGQRPLAVFFEQGDCHACDILHTQPLQQTAIRRLFERFDSVQINMYSNMPLVTPDGRSMTANAWARELGLFFAPAIVFFDENGREIIRVDSVVHFFRLRNVLNYVLTKGYLSYPTFQQWRAFGENRERRE